MNSVILIGRLAKDPELRYSPSQVAVCSMTIAVDRPVKQGEEKKADFLRVVCYGKQAENASKFLSKGRQVAVQGRIQTGSYKDKNGNTVYTTDILALSVEYLSNGQTLQTERKSSQRSNTELPAPSPTEEYDPYSEEAQMAFENVEEDIPF